ncbi:beta-glucosidase G like protein [Verticillium longisporum]|nr:beta-glucosidase G like protein [Verticillium longisporum]
MSSSTSTGTSSSSSSNTANTTKRIRRKPAKYHSPELKPKHSKGAASGSQRNNNVHVPLTPQARRRAAALLAPRQRRLSYLAHRRTTLMLVSHLRAHGARVAVVAPLNHTEGATLKGPSGEKNRNNDRKNSQDPLVEIRLHGYPLPFNPELSVVYPVRVTTLFARTFGADEPPDLIYLASPASLGFQVLLQMRQQPWEKRVPVICNFQTDLAGYCAILFPHPLSTVAVFAFAMVQSYLFRHESVRTIFYPSRFVRRYLEAQGVQRHKMDVLRRGVDTALFRPGRRSDALRRAIAPDGEVILLCVSRVAGEKGFDFLARAAAALRARGLKFVLYVVGGNRNREVEREVHALFHGPLRDEGRVVFAGFKTGEDLATAYASGDIFLHCSVTETFGLVVLESMASGCGHLVPAEDLDGFVDRVMGLAEDRATWDKINNQVAWRMADTIEEREKELAQLVPPAAREVVTSRIVDARLAGGLGVVMTFWVFTGLYLALTEVGLTYNYPDIYLTGAGLDPNNPPPARDVRANHADIVRKVAAAGTVLLKNTNNVLPLGKPKNVGVFGNGAADVTQGLTYTGDDSGPWGPNIGALSVGGGSGAGRHTRLISPLFALRGRIEDYRGRVQYLLDNHMMVEDDFTSIYPTPEVCLVFLKTWSREGTDRLAFENDWNSTVVVENYKAFA